MKIKINQKTKEKINQKTKEKTNQTTKEKTNQTTKEKTNQTTKIKVGFGSQIPEKVLPEQVPSSTCAGTPADRQTGKPDTTVINKEEPEKVIDKIDVQKVEDKPEEQKVRKERVDKGKKRRGRPTKKERFEIPFAIGILAVSKLIAVITKNSKWVTTDEESEDFEVGINECLAEWLPEKYKVSRGMSHVAFTLGGYFVDRIPEKKKQEEKELK